MTHDELVAEILDRARARGILTHYCGNAVRCQGNRGLPDVIAVGKYSAAWIEVKTPGDKLSTDQTIWMYSLKGAGHAHHVIHPEQLYDGTLNVILNNLISA